MSVAKIVGLTVKEMREKYPDIFFRIVNVNGKEQLRVKGHVPTRYNLVTKDGIIIDFSIG